MTTLWLSFCAGTDLAGLRASARAHLDGQLGSEHIDEALTVIAALVDHAGGEGELIVSRRDNSLLIELVTRTVVDGSPPSPPTPCWACGAYSTGPGGVIWAELEISRGPGPRLASSSFFHSHW
ncbi:hypothetical protein FHR83_003606 [Actinoplanes campanulatus]|uniref:Histidine kinase-like ATPase domain-containing protein n=1 Tax=Actinoplanes campanulatus TaxID=113559 RepID=A0A7W5FEZ3_9ACTN|nr:hypothetical protein [Actinoplanes campanulatus]MBB3095936.1 hypothetical protein [Actinoplanes campanulatus]GGN12537.1 hypothetical protein GCM10010109_23190 [Actinoplanes campanulatus]GID36969.1 hypothetical protein Aca09nite_34750 [Actinoplanes campanulatus]